MYTDTKGTVHADTVVLIPDLHQLQSQVLSSNQDQSTVRNNIDNWLQIQSTHDNAIQGTIPMCSSSSSVNEFNQSAFIDVFQDYTIMIKQEN